MRFSPAILLALCLLGTSRVVAEQDAATAELELDRVREQIQALEQVVQRSVADRSETQRALRDAEVAAAKANRRLQAVSQEREQAVQRLARLQAEESRGRLRLAGEQAVLAEQLRMAYMSGREEWLRLVLSQQDPVDAGRQFVYYGYLTRQRSSLIESVRQTLAELAATVAAVAAERERLEKLQAEQRERVAQLDASRAERATALKKLEQELQGRQGELGQLRKQAADLEALVKELREALAELSLGGAEPFAERRGQLAWPADGRARHRFGQPRADGGLRWEGTLLAARAGSDVRAVHYGRVVFADWLNGMGLLIVVDHGDGYMTLYGHNQDLVRDVGEWVAPGEVLGHVGDTGGQAEAGLYFEIRKDGKPVDPKRWIRR
ncbi:MAG: peptidoglycan DD-metalloendopeptidase family protein [Chromatiales bacterium]|nr:MAG: peptidoglycan DD-metalloendopeptidase family protein [Chromatiales bacterium]